MARQGQDRWSGATDAKLVGIDILDAILRGATHRMTSSEPGDRGAPVIAMTAARLRRRISMPRGGRDPRGMAALAARGWQERFALRRGTIARAYIRGTGIEIGALNKPLRVPRGARVTYVDRLPVDQLRQHYPDIPPGSFVPVDIVDDGERLPTIASSSQDFVIANHFLEHCQDPIGTLGHLLRVVRPGGVLYIAVPDKRFTFDSERRVTPLGHLIADHEHGPERSLRDHLDEWARLVDRVPAERVAAWTDQLQRIGYSIHYHVWSPPELLELVVWLGRDGALPFTPELFLQRKEEMILILRKT